MLDRLLLNIQSKSIINRKQSSSFGYKNDINDIVLVKQENFTILISIEKPQTLNIILGKNHMTKAFLL